MMSHKWLLAQRRVVFDANYSRTRRLERSLIRNPENPQSPKLPLYKEKLRNLSKLRKVEHKTKETRFFFLSRRSNFAVIDGKVTKKQAAHTL